MVATIISIGILVVILISSAIVINNRIIAKKNTALQAFGSVEIYLKKRFDLVPNLVALIKQYMAHEKEILLKATELRSKIENTGNSEEKINASNEFSSLISQLNLNVENYPNLKADSQFLNLHHQLTDLEDYISASRRAYNASVTSYNNIIQMFPANIIAGIRKDKIEPLLDIPKTEQKDVNINQLFN
ncbi:LemA family protein [uncultured Sunxiuqinia sp.]|uniref:LemA family protein n=1 Tax=uncultured Sunxiuqinia sp. TaxID=1573825 RepID=UPI002AA9573B|nr:LemA family protein [uncultured Sunxiuqinia sp.]